MTQPIVPPSPPTSELPSPEPPATIEPGDLAEPPHAAPPPLPDKLPEPVPPPGVLPPLYPWHPELPDTAQLPAVDLDLASSHLRARAPRGSLAPCEQIRTLVFAPEPARAAWIDRELSHAPITIQIGRSASAIVAALTEDPPPRPDVLVVDFDAIAPVDLVGLHAIRPGGWFGRLIGVGHVPLELRSSLGVDHVLALPLIRDSLLDCVAGTRHAEVTVACSVFPERNDRS